MTYPEKLSLGFVLCALYSVTVCVHAQSSPAAAASASQEVAAKSDPVKAAGPVQVGDATRRILQLQRKAGGPSRSIGGEEASLSYQRYLDSFKHPIPQYMQSTLGKSSPDK